MKMTVGLSSALVDVSSYPDIEAKGQTLVLQNLGPGSVFIDFKDEVTPETGVEIGVNGGYELPRVGKLYAVADLADTDLRILVVG